MFASPELIVDDPTPGSELLDASRLDFTVESFGLVDDYFDLMGARQLEEGSEDYYKLVLRFGASLGEVVLRNTKAKTYHWLDYKGALKINKNGACIQASEWAPR
jgi:hypothetical protein